MIDTAPLRRKLLDLAITGKLVPKQGEWRTVKLGDVCDVARGGSPRPIKDYLTEAEDGLNWIKIGDAEVGSKYIVSVRERIRREGLKKTRMVYCGDLLLTNSMSFGHPYILKVDGCIHDGWLVLHPSPVIDKEFLYYVLMAPDTMQQFKFAASGGVVSNLNSDKVSATIIPLPSLAEQKAIVKRLEELLKLEGEIAAESAALDDLITAAKRKVLDLAIRGKLVPQDPSDEPASELLKRIAEKRETQVSADRRGQNKGSSVIFRGADRSAYETRDGKTVCIDDEIPFDIPDSWVWVRLESVCDILDSLRKPVTKKDRVAGPYPYYGATCIQDYVAEYIFDEPLVLLGEDGAKWDTGEHSAFAINGKSWVNNHAHVLRPLERIEHNFICHCLNSLDLMSYITGTTVPKLNQEKMRTILIPIPPIAEQKRIVAKVEEIGNLIELAKRT